MSRDTAPMALSVPSNHTLDSKRLLEKATCGQCGYSWPWAHFTLRDQIGRQQNDPICIKCYAPEKYFKRWMKILAQARQSMKVARNTLENARNQAPTKASQAPPIVEDQSVLLPRKHPRHNSKPLQPLIKAAQVPSQPPLPLPMPVPVAYPQPNQIQQRPPPPLHQQPQPQYAYPTPPAPIPQGAYMTEPTRAFHWILANYYPNPSSSLEQMSVFNHYVDCFRAPTQQDPKVPRLLGGIDFLMLLPRAFPGCRLNGRGYLVEGIARIPASQELAHIPRPMPVQVFHPQQQISTPPLQYMNNIPQIYPANTPQINSYHLPHAYSIYPPSNTQQLAQIGPPPVQTAGPSITSLPTPPLTGTMTVASRSRKRPRSSELPIQVIDITSTDDTPTPSDSDITTKQDLHAGGKSRVLVACSNLPRRYRNISAVA
ncbi:hypothetical protein BCR39DRAFT_286621 [Naematelia encephala]|uniref:Uncharacterized protein n=1 Tax=Naematelia encephala TaxID=71784 RepID=A0A1Y2AT07_9TREE|nr:hypothetical protein BCR39DRAFT_286621 [Naematelia encephala]